MSKIATTDKEPQVINEVGTVGQAAKEQKPHAETKAGPHISIKGETIFHVGNFPVTNSLITSTIVLVLFGLLASHYSSQIAKHHKSKLFYILNGTLKALYSLFQSVLHTKAALFFTLLSSFFFFILLNNWMGLFPGVGSLLISVSEHGELHKVPLLRGSTADLNTTIALALVTVIFTQIQGFKFLGAANHLKKYASPIGLLEAITEISRILSFSFRLFGNIFAGEVMLAIVAFLLPIFTPPFFLMEIFVGFIQAIVFTMLTAVFINMAVEKHH